MSVKEETRNGSVAITSKLTMMSVIKLLHCINARMPRMVCVAAGGCGSM
jgi:hypothetical protein